MSIKSHNTAPKQWRVTFSQVSRLELGPLLLDQLPDLGLLRLVLLRSPLPLLVC